MLYFFTTLMPATPELQRIRQAAYNLKDQLQRRQSQGHGQDRWPGVPATLEGQFGFSSVLMNVFENWVCHHRVGSHLAYPASNYSTLYTKSNCYKDDRKKKKTQTHQEQLPLIQDTICLVLVQVLHKQDSHSMSVDGSPCSPTIT